MKLWVNIKLSYAMAVLLLASSAGCNQVQIDSADSNNTVARSHQKAEGIELTVAVSPAKLRLSDELVLTMTIRKQAELRVELPGFEESLAEFSIRDVQNPLPKLDGDFEIIQQSYRMEPTRDGKQTIIPPAVSYFPKNAKSADGAKDPSRSDGNSQPSAESTQIIEVEPLEIEVTTELASQTAALDQLRPENQPLELPPARRNLAVWIALLAVAISLLAILIAVLATKRSKAAQQLSPRELARLELKKLVDDNWSRLDPKRYFFELTGIVRRFIERTTGVRAPEQTTEEFLQAIAGDQVFAEDIQLRLREFLESADLVKFAGLKPSEQDIAESLHRAGRFIEAELLPENEVESEAGLARGQISK
jgi:hypothetical protein